MFESFRNLKNKNCLPHFKSYVKQLGDVAWNLKPQITYNYGKLMQTLTKIAFAADSSSIVLGVSGHSYEEDSQKGVLD